jgi:hypothetical protein
MKVESVHVPRIRSLTPTESRTLQRPESSQMVLLPQHGLFFWSKKHGKLPCASAPLGL